MSGIYWLASYPKSGNTWFRIFLTNYLANGDAPFDINEPMSSCSSGDSIATPRELFESKTGLESALMTHDEIEVLQPLVFEQLALESKDDFYIKTHFACHEVSPGLPITSIKGTKGAIHIVRNPLDVALSYADHFGTGIDNAIGELGEHDFTLCGTGHVSGKQLRQKIGSWSDHTKSWLDARWFPVKLLRYEEMKNDPVEAFGRAIRFLGLPYDLVRLKKAIAFSDFNELKKQEQEKGFKERSPHSSGSFFRKGGAGQWKESLSPEQVSRILQDHGEMMRRLGYL